MPSNDIKGETDARLMALVTQGDMPAFGRLYEKYGDFVDHAILSIAPSLSRSEVEDLCQDVFLALRKGARRYEEAGKLNSWIYSHAIRITKQHRRRWAIRGRILGMVKGQRVAISNTEQVSPDVGAMVRLDMGKLLGRLTDIQRQVLILYEQDGLKGKEIGEILGMNVNTVWTHLRRAREELNAHMKRADERGGAR
jgi:RNA polymerase sigma-70 factor (ECF subfamily)